MTKKNSPPEPAVEEVAVEEVVAAPAPRGVERMDETDRLSLELAKQQRLVANAEAKAALANTEKTELAYKYFILQVYMKYNLTAADAIKENGEIIRGGAQQG